MSHLSIQQSWAQPNMIARRSKHHKQKYDSHNYDNAGGGEPLKFYASSPLAEGKKTFETVY